ncbi:MAG TPA: isoleucine--tRNA ligase [Candidatus Acidoferrales bacterium]|nr:isoleucine--tRNA ligase [Candidatus Acidoferrales bacterium]
MVAKSKYVGELPKQYDHKVVETEVHEVWDRDRTYELVKKVRLSGEKFYFLDGPPFPSSDTPHIGTSWNKVLKDTVIRYKRSRGFNVRDQPGYDCHGLPIELAIEQKFGVKSKKEIESFGLERFISECRSFAETNAAAMTNAFQDLGIWMDWNQPYMTHLDYYIECDWWGLKQAWSKGLFEHGQRVVHWCPRCETVLSDYEVVLEYKMLRDPSIYVKFPVVDRPNEYILIWTTTPWTLPSNVAVMVNPDFQYVRVKSEDETYIFAKERIGAVQKETGRSFELLDAFPGSKLEGLRYKGPLENLVPAQLNLQNGHRVVLTKEYVTLTEGTGCVHSAPGHGEEDYEVGIRNSLPVLMLVDDQGKFIPEAGKYAGKSVRDANPEIIDDLKSLGALLYAGEIEHRSPVCWRCKTPLIIRATKQWLIHIAQLKDLFIKEVDSTLWIPAWAGANQFKNWLQGLKDWVISRQRFWGTPLPVWSCTSCGKDKIIGSKQELLNNAVSKVDLPTLHRPWVDAVKLRCDCGGDMIRVQDVIDVWFESGGASLACLGHPANAKETKFWWPADFIVEGRDQITAWFFGLLRHGTVTMGQCPYKTVLMHGFALDAQGREMHKSLGNFVSAKEVVEKFGRDAFRYYVLQTTLWEDLQFSWDAVRQHQGDLSTIWNTFVFASTYMSLDKFSPAELSLKRVGKSLRPEDRWLLSRTHRTIKEVTTLMDEYKVHEALRKLKTFLVEDISHTYIRYVRRRTWVEKRTQDKQVAYATLYSALESALIMLTPTIPYLTESIYQHMFRNAHSKNPATVHLLKWPKPDSKWIVDSLEEEMKAAQSVISTVAVVRMGKSLKQRQPVPQIFVTTESKPFRNALKTYAALLREQTNTRRLKPVSKDSLSSFTDSERYAKTDFPEGTVLVDLKLSKSELAEGLARDAVRRMQQMRKEMDLKVDSFVHAYVVAPSKKEANLLKIKSGYIAGEVRAKKLKISIGEIKVCQPYYTKRWQIDGATFEFGLCETSKLNRKTTA